MNPIVYTVLDLLAKSAGILLLAWAVQTLWRRASAAQRCLVWLASFAVLLLLPLTVFMKPLWTVQVPEEKAAPLPKVVSAPMPEMDDLPVIPRTVSAPRPVGVAPIEKPTWHLPELSAWEWAEVVWATGAAGLLFFRFLGSLQLRWLRSRSRVCEEPRLLEMMLRHAQALGVRRRVDLRISDRVTVPLTWGFIKPVLLMPEAALQKWTDAQIDAALCHELGHIRHWDALSHSFMAILCALQWPNALLWFAAKSWRLAQEQACDDLVLDSGAATHDYAAQLLEAARSVRRFGLVHAAALTMAVPSTLETRLTAIMDGRRDRRPMKRKTVLAGAGAALSLLGLCATLQVRAASDDAGGSAKNDRPVQVYYLMRIMEIPGGAKVPEEFSPPHKDALPPYVIDDDQVNRIISAQVVGMKAMYFRDGVTMNGQDGYDSSATQKLIDPVTGQESFAGVKRHVHITDEGKQIHVDVSATYNHPVEETGRLELVPRSTQVDQRVAPGATLLMPFSPLPANGAKDTSHLYMLITARKAIRTHNLSLSADKIEYSDAEHVRGTASGHVQADVMRDAPVDDLVRCSADVVTFDLENESIELTGHPMQTIDLNRYVGTGADTKMRVSWKDGDRKPVIVGPSKTEIIANSTPGMKGAIPGARRNAGLIKKLQSIILPSVQLKNASPVDALEFLRMKAREFDKTESDDSKKGVNFSYSLGKNGGAAQITLDLQQVPLEEALRYITELAGLKFRLESGSVIVYPPDQEPPAKPKSVGQTPESQDKQIDDLKKRTAEMHVFTEKLQADVERLEKIEKRTADNKARSAVGDEYFKAYLLFRDAEKLRETGTTAKAREKYLAAQLIIAGIASQHPEWQTEVVKFRLEKIRLALQELNKMDTFSTQITPQGAGPAPSPEVAATTKEDWPQWPTTVKNLHRMDELDDKGPLAIGDCLSFRIVEDGDRIQKIRIPSGGVNHLPYLGEMKLVGLTPRQACEKIKAALEKGHYFKKATPLIAVEYLPPQGYFTVRGEVKRHGRYDIGMFEHLNVEEAIARSGGFTEEADRDRIHLHTKAAKSVPGAVDHDFTVKYDDLINAKSVWNGFPVTPDIDIVVDKKDVSTKGDAGEKKPDGAAMTTPEKDLPHFFSIFGQVGRQGKYELPDQDLPPDQQPRLSGALKRAGLTPLAKLSKVHVVRRSGTTPGKNVTINVNAVDILNYGKTEKDILIRPNDVIIVDEKLPTEDKTKPLEISAAEAAKLEKQFPIGAPTPVEKRPETRSMDELDDKEPLRVADLVSFRIVEDREKALSLRVDPSGDLFVPHIGRVPVAGLTCKKVATNIKAELEKTFDYKQATVFLVMEYRSSKPISTIGADSKSVAQPSTANMDQLDDSDPLRAGDCVRVRIIEDHSRPIALRVQPSGDIQAPYIGLLHVEGLTSRKASLALKAQLEKLSQFKQATVLLVRIYRPNESTGVTFTNEGSANPLPVAGADGKAPGGPTQFTGEFTINGTTLTTQTTFTDLHTQEPQKAGSASTKTDTGTLTFAAAPASPMGVRMFKMDELDDVGPLKVGDSILVNFIEEGQTRSTSILPSGNVEFPNLNPVKAAGLTQRKLAYALQHEIEKSQGKKITVLVAVPAATAPPQTKKSEPANLTFTNGTTVNGQTTLTGANTLTITSNSSGPPAQGDTLTIGPAPQGGVLNLSGGTLTLSGTDEKDLVISSGTLNIAQNTVADTGTIVLTGNTLTVMPAVQAKAQKLMLPRVWFTDATLDEALTFLRTKSKDLDPDKKGVALDSHAGSAARGVKISLDLKSVPLWDALKYVASLANLELKVDGDRIVLEEPGKVDPAAPAPPAPKGAGSAAELKASKIMLPRVSFKDAPVKDAVDFFRLKSRELDPEKKGVNIIERYSPGEHVMEGRLELSDVSLADALRFFAQTAHLKLSADDSAFFLDDGKKQGSGGGKIILEQDLRPPQKKPQKEKDPTTLVR